MSLNIFNTKSKKIEPFIPLEQNIVKMYSCGPTVYNYPHIGNYRAYIFADTLKRSLVYLGYEVKHIMNITDIDDKTIRNSQKENKTLKEFTEFYTKEFLKDLESLNIIYPEKFTKATDYINEMVDIIQKLLNNNLAYKSEDGSIYFDIKKFKNYGELSNIKIENQKQNAQGRIKNDEYDKENIQDFALWKSWGEEDGEVFWDTPLGKGRPGWHIECSAMSMTELGEELDIHTGGVDNIFPHHENEIAQSEGATGKTFVKYWMHNEWVLVDNKKMSKSLNNIYSLRDLNKKAISPLAYKLWLFGAHYRSRINFVLETLEGSQNAFKKLQNTYLELGNEIGEIDANYQKKFIEFIENDLDTPKALALTWELLKDEKIENKNKKATLLDFDKVFGFGLETTKEEIIPNEINVLLKEREEAKKNKDFEKADEIREKIENLGYKIKDTEEGQKVNKI